MLKKEKKIVFVGLDGAGKTSILYRIKMNKFIQTEHTLGFNLETVQYKDFLLNMWDIQGSEKIRALWHHYFIGVDSLIFVIDTST